MPQVIRRLLGLGALIMVVAGAATQAHADAPPGPRLAFLQFAYRPDALTIGSSDAALGELEPLAGGGIGVRPLPYPLSGPSWSPDGSLLAFSGMTGPGQRLIRAENRRIYLVGADGSALHPIPGTRGGFNPVFSPDGQSVAFAKTLRKPARTPWQSTTVLMVGIDGTRLRQLTKWANGIEDLPSSFSPDGSVLALTHRDLFRDRADAVAMRLDGGGSYRLAASAAWPRYSPDGSQIAFLGIRRIGDTSCCERGDGFFVDLFAMNADRSSRRRLTDTPARAERPASWDPSGERLVYTTKSAPSLEASGDLESAVMEINADGTCLSRFSIPVSKVRAPSASFHYPTWQPGPGREAGPIDC